MEKREGHEHMAKLIIKMQKAKEIIGANFVEDDLFGNVYIVDANKIQEQFKKMSIELDIYLDIIGAKNNATEKILKPLAEVFSEEIKNKLTNY